MHAPSLAAFFPLVWVGAVAVVHVGGGGAVVTGVDEDAICDECGGVVAFA